MNNRQRAAQARRERAEPELYVHQRRTGGHKSVVPLRYLTPDERAAFLRRATSPL